MREPDMVGSCGRAWRVPSATAEQLCEYPDWRAGLVSYVLDIPGAHPFWRGYEIALVHLRDMPGTPPATRRYPEAEFEAMLWALNPDHPLPVVDDPRDFHPKLLTPANLVHQFHGVTDSQAIAIVELLARSFVVGRLSPDTDWRQEMIRSIDATVEHFRNGVHE